METLAFEMDRVCHMAEDVLCHNMMMDLDKVVTLAEGNTGEVTRVATVCPTCDILKKNPMAQFLAS